MNTNVKKDDGIIMANGVVLQNGLHRFKANKELVKNSLSYIYKISKGLYSGILNSDPDFIKFQEESIDMLIKKEADKLCESVVEGVGEQLHRISTQMAQNQEFNNRHYRISENRLHKDRDSVEPVEIILDKEKPVMVKRKPVMVKRRVESAEDIIRKRANDLASLNEEEIRKINKSIKSDKKINKKKKVVKCSNRAKVVADKFL